MKTWFCKRGYPHKIVDAQIKRVSEKGLDELFKRLDEKETGVPLVVANHPRFHNLGAIIKKIFYVSQRKLREVLHLHHLFHFVLVTV